MLEDECKECMDKRCRIGCWDVHGVQDGGLGLLAGRGCRKRVLQGGAGMSLGRGCKVLGLHGRVLG